ncbi:WhiB family transcriptional regulator [Streptomyces sp. NPDC057910]|uniref:WhiB family transcriptional regulator n=1 Tax=Streptomyces sp. NPDC057910 TaxID=3346278 RepID=UPI001E0DB351|nr:WhiB family transcriptional regulator [Streptomyces sp. MAG02]
MCAQTDPEVFFPPKGVSTAPAKALCFACDARVECLTYALDHAEQFGIWGGMTERGRRRVLNFTRVQAA